MYNRRLAWICMIDHVEYKSNMKVYWENDDTKEQRTLNLSHTNKVL